MKKILMTMAAALMAVTMNAQNMYVGGSLGYSTTSQDGTTLDTRFSLIPEFGVSFNDKMGVGVEIGYSSDKDEQSHAPNTVTESTFKFAPYFRYTALKLGNVSVFGDGQFSYATTKTETKAKNGNTNDQTVNNWGLYVKPGIAYNLNEKFALVAKFGNIIGYTSNKLDVNGAKAKSTFELLNLTNNIQFGFYYNF
jgi:hypothetical protein